jgi:hypothetical protein
VGWRYEVALFAVTRNSTLTNSIIVRRLLYGLLVTRELEFVQHTDPGKSRFVYTKADEKAPSHRATN